MPTPRQAYQVTYDLSNCDAEPLHRIQLSHPGTLTIVADKDLRQILAITATAEAVFGKSQAELLKLELPELLHPDTLEVLKAGFSQEGAGASNPIEVNDWQHSRNTHFQNLIAHRQGELIYLEFEARDPAISQLDFMHELDRAVQTLQSTTFQEGLFQRTATLVKQLSGYDRVMIYRFDEEYNGEVVAEARNEELEPFLHLHYPHTDIPKQARELYLRNQIRHIPDALGAQDNFFFLAAPSIELDLSDAVNRGTSPIHIEYLRNMRVGASLSAAIVVNQRLWGLIACHHYAPKLVDYRLRSMISFFSKIMAGQLALYETNRFREDILQTNLQRSQLFEQMSEEYDVVGGLFKNRKTLLSLMEAEGVILFFDQQLRMHGQCPAREEAEQLIAWLKERPENLFATHQFFEVFPGAAAWQHPPAGILSSRISHEPGEFIIWLRPEVARTVTWGGRPDERKEVVDGKVRINPRLSFKKWVQQVERQAVRWQQHHRDAALALRNDIKEIIIQKYQEVRQLNEELTTAYEELESFSYTVSHDLRAPLRTIRGFAEILEEDYAEKLDEHALSVINTIVSSVGKMNQFINDILDFSRFGRTELIINQLDLNYIANNVWEELNQPQTPVKLSIPRPLPRVPGDATQIRQLLLNLLSNAIKYSRDTDVPMVSVSWKDDHTFHTLAVTDNGIGFDMRYADRIFAVFHRLVSSERYEGTGVGLAIAKRIVDRHNGRIWVESEPGIGTTFFVSLPKQL